MNPRGRVSGVSRQGPRPRPGRVGRRTLSNQRRTARCVSPRAPPHRGRSINSRALSERGGLSEVLESLFGVLESLLKVILKIFFGGRRGGERVSAGPLQERKEQPRPPSVDPGHSKPELCHEPRVPHVRLATKPATIVRCRSTEYPLSPTARYPSEL